MMSEVPFSPFVIEYAVMEQEPDKPGKFREILTTTVWDVARGALAGLNMQFKMREKWEENIPVSRFTIVSRLVGARWMHPDEVNQLTEVVTIGLQLYDQKHGYPPGNYAGGGK